ncbi:MAG: branched-chain amino acid ABC transporter ATP-binding protein/permease [Actinomycetales bacterium]|nr:branched-chain amino acid ABC transporter ATP-binding protein/permease [Actinomycetales bacterium]
MRNRLKSPRVFVPLGLLLLLGLYPLVPDSQYEQSVLITCLLFAIMASGWNLISGMAGYVSLGHSVYLGIGMYTGAIAATRWGWDPFYLAPLGALVAGVVALLIGLVVLRTRAHAFVIITIAVLLSFQLLSANLKQFTGGTEGLTLGAPGWPEEWGNTPYFYMFYAILLLTLALAAYLMSSRLGAGLVAIRNDEGKAASIGVNTTVYKTIANVLSALPFGAAGVIYGQYLSFVNPSGAFSILTSVYLVLAALVGGRGTLWGPVLGGFIVALANEGATVAAGGVSARVLIMGLVLVLTVMFLPAGLLPTLTGLMTRRRASRSTVKYIDQAAIARHDSHLDITSLISRGAGQRDTGTAVLEVRDVVKRFGGVRAVDGVSLTVERGSITGLIGPNGSGKTTLFNCLTGTVRPDKGTVLLDGEDVTSDKVWTRAHGGLGRTFQVTRLFRSMTVLDNLVAPLERTSARQMVAGRYSGEEVDRARDILGFMGLQDFEKQNAAALSFGQQKLVELAQVLMLRPSVVLLDEPASGINPTLIEKLTKVIRQLNEAGTTVLIVEHNIPLVLGLCDTVHVLAGGKILTSGTPDVIRNDPLVIEAYLGPDHLLEAPRG